MSNNNDPIQSGNTIKTVYKHYALFWNPQSRSVIVVVKSNPPSTFVVTKAKAIEMLEDKRMDIHYQLLYSEILDLCNKMENSNEQSSDDNFHLQRINIKKYLRDTEEGE